MVGAVQLASAVGARFEKILREVSSNQPQLSAAARNLLKAAGTEDSGKRSSAASSASNDPSRPQLAPAPAPLQSRPVSSRYAMSQDVVGWVTPAASSESLPLDMLNPPMPSFGGVFPN